MGFSVATARKPPQLIHDGGLQMQSFLNAAANLNKWAAGATAVSTALSVVAELLSTI
jgi:hypothetical protein